MGDSVSTSSPNDNYRVLSQMDVIQYLFLQKPKNYSNLKQKTVEELSLQKGGVCHIDNSEENRGIDAYRRMILLNCSALAVTDVMSGKLNSTISPSDLKGLPLEAISRVCNPLPHFLKLVSREKPIHSIAVVAEDSLEKVLGLINESRVHRVWVVNENQIPVGVISLSDVLRMFQDGVPYL